jgi:hypothetical protein
VTTAPIGFHTGWVLIGPVAVVVMALAPINLHSNPYSTSGLS